MCETSKVSRPWLPDCPSQFLLSFWSLTEGAMFRLISFRIHCFWCLHLGVSDLVHASNAGLTCLSVTWRNWRTYNLIQFEICSPNFERMRTSNNTCTKQKWIHNLQETSVPTCVPQITCWNGWSTNQIQPRHILGQSDWRASLSDNWHKLNGFALPKNKNITTSSLVICRSFGSFVENHPYTLFIPLRVRPRNCWASRARRWCRPLDVRRPPSPTRNWRPIGWHRALRRNRPMSNGVVSWKWSICFLADFIKNCMRFWGWYFQEIFCSFLL